MRMKGGSEEKKYKECKVRRGRTFIQETIVCVMKA